jgi:hypothetical protein
VSDDETHTLMCTPVDSPLGPGIRDSTQRVCTQCGNKVWVSPSSLPYVQRGEWKPVCLWHKPPEGTELGELFPDQALELWSHGMTQDDLRRALASVKEWVALTRRIGV